MSKIVFIGAGSAMFTKNLIGDLLTFNDIKLDTISLVDINKEKLDVMDTLVKKMCKQQKKNIKVESTTERRAVLKNADYVICTIGVGGVEAYKKDLEIPDKYGIDQNVGDTIGPGGTFRGLRVIPEIVKIAKDMEELCPNAILFQYSNPMAAICIALHKVSNIKTVGLCHSVQGTALQLANYLRVPSQSVSYWCAGINHMAWYLEFKINGKDAYPDLKKLPVNQEVMDMLSEYEKDYAVFNVKVIDTVRFKIMHEFGYFVTESPFHMSEYVPYFRKNKEAIEKLRVSKRWWLTHEMGGNDYFNELKRIINNDEYIPITKTYEYAPDIIRSIETGVPFRSNLNVPNTGLITNLPEESCVEVPCFSDSEGIHPCYVGNLPEQCASLNRTNINVQIMIAKAALEKKKEYIFQAIALDPLTSALLDLDQINAMVEEMIIANKEYLKDYK
jgi:alpha-galactosidase